MLYTLIHDWMACVQQYIIIFFRKFDTCQYLISLDCMEFPCGGYILTSKVLNQRYGTLRTHV